MPSELWFSGFDPDGGNSWASGDDQTGADPSVTVEMSPSQIQTGGQTKMVVKSADLALLGKTVTITFSSPTIAGATSMTAPMEMDPYGGAAATFLIDGLSEGTSSIGYQVNG